jgi:uncharacterized membrane protein
MQPAMTSSARRICMAITVFALAGVVVSSIALYHHYGTSATSYCDFGQNFNCDIVNRSTYSSVMGIPVALIGLIGYLTLAALATFCRSKIETPAMLLIGSTLGLGFALYLTYIEAYVLGVWCVLCLSSLTAMVLITILSSVLVAQSLRRVDSVTSR